MQPNITKSAMLNGLIVGVLLSLKFIFSAQKFNIFGLLAVFISVLIVFVLYRMSTHFRDTECSGTIKYGHAFNYIFLVYFFGSLISSFVILGYTSFFDTNYLASMLDVLLKMYDSFKFPVDDKTIKILETIYKPAPFSLLNVFSSMIVGVFWGLILAALVKKEKRIFEE